MIVKQHAQGKFYRVACPEGSQIIRHWNQRAADRAIPYDVLVVPFEGKEIPIPAAPPGLLPLLAESGRCCHRSRLSHGGTSLMPVASRSRDCPSAEQIEGLPIG